MSKSNRRTIHEKGLKIHDLAAYLESCDLRQSTDEYRIVIPSRKRWENMPVVMGLLPTAYVSVSDSEAEEYLEQGVPEDRLMVHGDDINCLSKKRNWVWDNTPEECCIQIDDDFHALVCRIGKKPRRIKDPAAILQIIETTYQVAKDMEVPAFCWSRTINIRQGQFKECDPITLAPMLSNAWGQIGNDYRADTRIFGRPDMDLSLQMILKDRIFYCDERYYFDCGIIFQQEGGNQGLRTSKTDQQDSRYIKRKWQRYVQFGKKNVAGSHKMAIRVPRRQK